MGDPFTDRFKSNDDDTKDAATETPEGVHDVEVGQDAEATDRQVVRNQESGELEIVTSYADGSTTAEPYTDPAA